MHRTAGKYSKRTQNHNHAIMAPRAASASLDGFIRKEGKKALQGERERKTGRKEVTETPE